jgi:hypothetical protein
MVRPANFGFNEETAESNSFQEKDPSLSTQEIKQQALIEFDNFVVKLRAERINVHIVEDTVTPKKPDAVFPNNWVSFHQDGTVITYPIFAKARRKERRDDIIEKLQEQFVVSKIKHMEVFEEEGRFLESTGSMIMDRVYNLVYACVSPRTDPELMKAFCEFVGAESIIFNSVDANGQDIYHTNVMMALGETFMVICMETIHDEAERKKIIDASSLTNKEIIEITFDQVVAFAGNMLQVRNDEGETFLVMSQQAYESLRPDQIERIKQHTNILYSPINTIEKIGGGSARCMMAEIFLPLKD